MARDKQGSGSGFDFSTIMDSSDGEEAIVGVMSGLIEASHHQMQLAMKLTKLAVEKSSANEISAEKVFSIFKQASAVIAESTPLKSLLGKLGMSG